MQQAQALAVVRLPLSHCHSPFHHHHYPSRTPRIHRRRHLSPPHPYSLPSFTRASRLPLSLLSASSPTAAPQGQVDDDGGDASAAGFEIEIENPGNKNRRRIHARVRVEADLHTIWTVLTDYEVLAEFIPGLTVSQLLEKRDNFAKLYQVGQQDLALGLKFNAKGVIDCYEGDLKSIPSGKRRDIEFTMVEGDFQTFRGRWSIEQMFDGMGEDGTFQGQEYKTALSYIVEVEPKLWLPVRLLEGRLCREVKTNLLCIREEAQRVQRMGNDIIPVW